MTLNEYQTWTISRPLGHTKPIEYCSIGLAGEVGELLNLVKKKYLREDESIPEVDLLYELGDCLYYLAILSEALGFSLDEVASTNLQKLSREK